MHIPKIICPVPFGGRYPLQHGLKQNIEDELIYVYPGVIPNPETENPLGGILVHKLDCFA